MVAALDYSGATKITFMPGKSVHGGRIANDGEPGFDVPTTTLAEQVLKLPKKEYTLVCDIEGAELDLFQNEQKAVSEAYLLILETHPKIYPRKKFHSIGIEIPVVSHLNLKYNFDSFSTKSIVNCSMEFSKEL